MWKGPTVDDIPGYVPPRNLGEPKICINNNQKYTINIPMTPKGVHVMMNIFLWLQKPQYSDHKILAYLECKEGKFE